MMKKLVRHDLETEKAMEYVQRKLIGNTLSTLLQNADFKQGRFFTLLPTDAKLDGLCAFNAGGILPQNPLKRYRLAEQEAYYEVIPSIDEEISDYLLKKISESNMVSCIIDDIQTDSVDDSIDPDLKQLLYSYDKETYYVLIRETANNEALQKCLSYSNALWHSLCVLTDVSIPSSRKILSLQDLTTICSQIKLIAVRAYDNEGYVFWEKTQVHKN